VLSGRRPVAEATRAEVLAAVGRLGRGRPLVRTRSEAAGTGRERLKPVFVRCPYLLTDYFGLVVSSVVETLRRHGREVVLDAGESAQAADPLGALPTRDDVAGAVLVLPPEPGDELVALRRTGFPFVVVDPRTAPLPDIASVAAAHASGARRVTEHLLDLGHERIGVVSGPREWLAGADRAAGHASALVAAGWMPPAELSRSVEAGYRAGAELLDLAERPTAIVGFNDKVALGILRAAEERGLRVPADLSLAGFDDSVVAQATHPQLTTVRQPLAEMGRMAVGLLVRLMEGHEVEALHVELATELVVRGSTAAPAQR
jgi:LacI family transcriptional regulator